MCESTMDNVVFIAYYHNSHPNLEDWIIKAACDEENEYFKVFGIYSTRDEAQECLDRIDYNPEVAWYRGWMLPGGDEHAKKIFEEKYSLNRQNLKIRKRHAAF